MRKFIFLILAMLVPNIANAGLVINDFQVNSGQPGIVLASNVAANFSFDAMERVTVKVESGAASVANPTSFTAVDPLTGIVYFVPTGTAVDSVIFSFDGITGQGANQLADVQARVDISLLPLDRVLLKVTDLQNLLKTDGFTPTSTGYENSNRALNGNLTITYPNNDGNYNVSAQMFSDGTGMQSQFRLLAVSSSAIVAVPEPGSCALVGFAGVFLVGFCRNRPKKNLAISVA